MLKFLCLFAFVAGALATSNHLGPRNATRGQFPHQAYIRIPVHYSKEDFISCGATIISNRFVLIPAGCMHHIDDLHRVRLVVGATRMGPNITDGTQYVLDKARVHPKFHTLYSLNDIAVLRVNGSIKFTPNLVRPVALPTSDVSTHSPFPAITSGWGMVKPFVRAETLRFKDTWTVNRTECLRIKGRLDGVNVDTLCTKNPSGTGPAIHYAGSALLTRTFPKQLIGILSRPTVADDSPADYYTNIYMHLKFIRKSMKKLLQ